VQVISIYDNIRQTKDGKEITIDLFLEFIRDGRWQDIVLPLRTIKDKDERSKAKAKVPYVTVSGKFSERNIKGLVSHSGFICIDIDDVDPNAIKEIICCDKHVYAAYTSISGGGLAVLFKIDPAKHQEAFDGLQEYLYNNYNIVIDSSCRDVSRARYISYDPEIFINTKSAKFTSYVKKKAPTKIDKVVFAPGDFEDLINQIVERGLNICESYPEWLRCGFALANKFGESGREYYHAISQFSSKYDKAQADKQYSYCVKGRNSGTTISTLYYYIKQAGIPLYSAQTQLIASAASQAQLGGRTKEDTIKNLQQFEGIDPDQSTDIVNQVFDNKIIIHTDNSLVGEVEQWLRHNYTLRRNTITRYIENNNKPLQQKDFNTIFVAAKKVFEKLTFDLLDKIINSDFTKDYNPVLEYFIENKDLNNPGAIGDLWSTIKSDNPAYVRYFGTKWLVSIIASAHGQHSPLMLVLAGWIQNTGKTEFFRRLLPKGLAAYYAESKLDQGKDDEIMMTQKIVIMDDEMGGKSKKDETRMKELLSKQIFSLREPYGRNNVDLVRLAVLCGTSQDKRILSDPSGNRRIIPVYVNSIDHDAYNRIDKDEVFMAAYHLYKAGYSWQLTKDDIAELKGNTEEFERLSGEYELITKYFSVVVPGREAYAEKMTTTDIKVELERHTGQKLNSVQLGKELQRLGFVPNSKRVNGQPRSVYLVEKLDPTNKLVTPPTKEEEDRKWSDGSKFTPTPGNSEEDVPF
jgi:predicted P-loop ATPase